MTEQTIVCYIENNVQKFDTTDNHETWQKDHPNARISYLFKKSDDIIKNNIVSKENFQFQSQFYGFSENDYKAKLIIRNQIGTLIGFLPQNRKYKCSVVIDATGKRYKMTISGVKAGIAEYIRKYKSEG